MKNERLDFFKLSVKPDILSVVTSPQPPLPQWSDMCCVRSHQQRVMYSLGVFDAF